VQVQNDSEFVMLQTRPGPIAAQLSSCWQLLEGKAWAADTPGGKVPPLKPSTVHLLKSCTEPEKTVPGARPLFVKVALAGNVAVLQSGSMEQIPAARLPKFTAFPMAAATWLQASAFLVLVQSAMNADESDVDSLSLR
jgi:hypothetical protein